MKYEKSHLKVLVQFGGAIPFMALTMIGFSIANAYAGPNCKCSAGGKTYLEGQLACINLPSGSYVARCESVLNNTSWTKILDGCPNSSNQINKSVWDKKQIMPS